MGLEEYIWMACKHWYMMIPFWVQYAHFRYITNMIVSKLGILLMDVLTKLVWDTKRTGLYKLY